MIGLTTFMVCWLAICTSVIHSKTACEYLEQEHKNGTSFCSSGARPGPNSWCRCDRFCSFYKDCCKECGHEQTKGQHQQEPALAIEYMSCERVNGPTERLWMVTRCTPSIKMLSYFPKCQNPMLDHTDPLQMIPVYSYETGLHYRNFYCAICNHAHERKSWTTGLQNCLNGDEVILKSSLTAFVKSIFKRHECSYVFSPPAGVEIRHCLPTVEHRCLHNCGKFATENLKKKRQSYFNPVLLNSSTEMVDDKIYRNLFCAACDGDQTGSDVDIACVSPDKDGELLKKPISTTVIIDVPDKWKTTFCDWGEIVKKGVCEKTICSEGQVTTNDGCVHPFKRIHGYKSEAFVAFYVSTLSFDSEKLIQRILKMVVFRFSDINVEYNYFEKQGAIDHDLCSLFSLDVNMTFAVWLQIDEITRWKKDVQMVVETAVETEGSNVTSLNSSTCGPIVFPERRFFFVSSTCLATSCLLLFMTLLMSAFKSGLKEAIGKRAFHLIMNLILAQMLGFILIQNDNRLQRQHFRTISYFQMIQQVLSVGVHFTWVLSYACLATNSFFILEMAATTRATSITRSSSQMKPLIVTYFFSLAVVGSSLISSIFGLEDVSYAPRGTFYHWHFQCCPPHIFILGPKVILLIISGIGLFYGNRRLRRQELGAKSSALEFGIVTQNVVWLALLLKDLVCYFVVKIADDVTWTFMVTGSHVTPGLFVWVGFSYVGVKQHFKY